MEGDDFATPSNRGPASLAEVPIEEPHDQLIGGARLGQLGVDKKRVPHAFIDVKLRVHACLHEQCVISHDRTHREISRSRSQQCRRKSGQDGGRHAGEDRMHAGNHVLFD